MSSSTSNSEREIDLRVCALVLLSLLIAEAAVRLGSERFSRNAAHVAAIPDTIAKFATLEGERILLVGNSQLYHGVDVASVESSLRASGREVSVQSLHPYATSITEWEAAIRTYVIPSPSPPERIVLLGTARHFDAPGYSQQQSRRVGANYSEFGDLPLMLERLDSTENRCEFLLAKVSVAHSNRRAVRQRIERSLIPNYAAARVRVNRAAYKRRRTKKKHDYTLLRETLGSCLRRGISVLVVLTPMRDEPRYVVPDGFYAVLSEFDAELYDAREGYRPADFLDFVHLGPSGRIRFTDALAKRLGASEEH